MGAYYSRACSAYYDMPTRVVDMLQLERLLIGFCTNQLHHALQTATMAKRAGADDEMVH